MPSGKSLFNPGLFFKNIKRFWPIWGMYLLIWAFALPMRIAVDRYPFDPLVGYAVDILASVNNFSIPLAFIFGPLCAMAVFSYLYKTKAANLIHTLPIRREGLFLTNFLSGLSFLIVPNVVIFLSSLAVSAARGAPYHPAAWLWLLVTCLCCLFFYCFAVFCAMFTGTLAALPCFYVIFNFVFPSVYGLINMLFEKFLYGFAGWSEDGWITALWPLVRMLYDIDTWSVGISPHTLSGVSTAARYGLTGVSTAVWYGVAGLVFAAAALLVYRKRHIERAGDVVSVGAMRPVFKYSVAFCCALVFGTMLGEWLGGWSVNDPWPLVGYVLLCGVLGYFAAEMLLRKSFRVLRAWKGCAAFTACLLLCCLAVNLDLTGFERRVPANAASVELTGPGTIPYDSNQYRSFVLTDPALIEEVRALHQAIIENELSGTVRPAVVSQRARPGVQTYTTVGLSLSYALDGGGTVLRRYNGLDITEALLDDPDSVAARLEALVNHPSLRAYTAFDETDAPPSSARLFLYDEGEVTLSTREAQAVFAAVQEDLAAGRLGRRFLLETQECLDTCYANTFYLTFPNPLTGQSVVQRGVPQPVYDYEVRDGQYYSVSITLQTTATSTIAALMSLGVIDGADDLTTMAEDYMLYR